MPTNREYPLTRFKPIMTIDAKCSLDKVKNLEYSC